ncbi:hypothetical protein [[Clostridium] symbiosum]|uniref:hypothetical protein n=1 Tax=Clostridium symbiosum TaxID=1512 RepID=UPI0034BA05B1
MIEQLKNLLDECRYMAAGGDPIWLADVQALEWALKQIEEKSCTNCTYECSCSWKPAADKAYCESWSPDIDINGKLKEGGNVKMKKELINCFTWYANRIAETVQYESWSDGFCRKENEENTHKFLEELKKHIDWNNLTEEICKELRFCKWRSDEGIEEEIKFIKMSGEINNEQELKDKIERLENSKDVWCIPLYLLPIVPVGTELTSIFGNTVIYDGHNVDKDIRMGCVAYGIKLNEQTERKMVDLMEEGIKKEECIKKQEEPERLIKEIHEIQKVIDHRTSVEKKAIKLIGECRFQEAMDLLSEDIEERNL